MTKFFRISSLIAAFAMSLTSVLNAAQVYLDAPNPYTQGNEVWYAWTWGEGNNGTWAPATDEGDGLLSFDVPEGNIIFVRMNSSAAGNPSWGAKWNQTDDLTVVDEGTYTITGWGEGDNPKMTGYWTEPDPYTVDGKPILTPTKRTALAGRNCMVNKLVNVVEAGSWINDLDNIVDEDLENYAEFPSIASVGVGVKPITSIRDVKHHYAAGTTAGFKLIADAGSLLNLNVASVYSIAFYLEGELQQTVAVSSGQTVNGIGLSLINIPSTDNACFDVIATAPCEFDEIALMPAGVNAQVGTSTKIKYAFVGDYSFNTITSNTENGMPVYAPAHNRMPFTLDAYPAGSGGAKIVDADLTNGWSWGVVSIGVSMDAKAISQFDRTDPDQSQCFKKGSTVGFLFSNSSLLKLPVGNGIVIRLYKGEWVEKERLITHEKYWEWEETEVQSENVGGSILELNVISGGDQYVSIIAEDDFSTVRFTTPTGLTLDLGFLQVKYAYVSDPTEVGHECNLKLSADNAITNKDNEYQLTEGGGIPVTWTIVSQPDGANAQVDANGLVTGMTVDGEYVIRGTAEDGCYDEVTITRGIESSYTADLCDEVIQNEGTEETYVLSEVSDGSSLIKINEQLDDP
ncbi:MAG: hypothetical protein IK092_05465, partial [Muribaculaceae bacterium]|nr:hypothetical protein [Muribaculaceae bacterium]